jgi:hypothetical protein
MQLLAQPSALAASVAPPMWTQIQALRARSALPALTHLQLAPVATSVLLVELIWIQIRRLSA